MILNSGTHLRQAGGEFGRQSSLDFRSDQPGFIEVLEVGFVLGAETGELHAHQVGKRDEAEAADYSGLSEVRNWFRVIISNFLAS